jgi:hypothetical protein
MQNSEVGMLLFIPHPAFESLPADFRPGFGGKRGGKVALARRAAMVTITLPLFSGRLATSIAATTFAPC